MTTFRGLAVSTVAIVLPAFLFFDLQGPTSALASQFFGAVALIAMALSHVIATRARFVESVFGPLDKGYILHKWLGITALAAILVHDSVGAEIKALGPESSLSDFAEGLGELSLNGLLVLLAITVITIIPYRIWYWTHRAMGACFVLGALHFAMIQKPFSTFDPLGLYVLAFCILGIACYAYSLAPRSWRRGFQYELTTMGKTGNACVINMKPVSHAMQFRPGQFAFFTFEEKGLTETHPFTISSAPRSDGSLQISVGALGDHTARFEQRLQSGMQVRVHGPYGRFTPAKGKKHQAWIAAGIGITPFLAALESMDSSGPEVDLIYSYRGTENAPHLQDLRELVAQIDRVKLHLFDTKTAPRLTAQTVKTILASKDVRYSYCGPKTLREALIRGLGARNFHYEAFEIRTGLPVPSKLLGFISFHLGKSNKINSLLTTRRGFWSA